MRLALYEPDIPQNAGTMMRMAACFGVGVDLIEPCGFAVSDRRMRRAGMDYLDHLDLTVHDSYTAFCRSRRPGRVILLTTQAPLTYDQVAYRASDTLMVGRESAGVPDAVHRAADIRVRIAMRRAPSLRSLNVATAAAVVLGEALRQTGGYAALAPDDAMPAISGET